MDNYQLKLEAPWDEVKEMLREINVDLTDEDLGYEKGKEKQLLEGIVAWVEPIKVFCCLPDAQIGSRPTGVRKGFANVSLAAVK